MSKSTERTKEVVKEYGKIMLIRRSERVKEQEEKHEINQKIQIAGELNALKNKIAKRRRINKWSVK